MSQFIDSIKEVKKNYKVYDNWEQRQADNKAKSEYLAKNIDLPQDKVELTKAKAETILRAVDILDKKSEDNCQNMERNTGIVQLLLLSPFMYLAAMKQPKNMPLKTFTKIKLGGLVGMTITAIGTILWGTAKQKEASRIGRFQAKQNELKDERNFVIYTPEQIEAAKILAKNIPDKKKSLSISKIINDMKQMSKDKVAYKNWLEDKIKNPEDIQKILSTKFTPQQLAQGETDKKIITNIVKDINIKAEEYSENLENSFETLGGFSAIAGVPIGFTINGALKKFVKSVKPSIRMAVSIMSPAIFTLSLLIAGASQQKQASRVGRFIKKKEILDNPELLITYPDEQMKQAENIKAPRQKKGFFSEIADNFKFLGKYSKELKEYKKNEKKTGKENEKIYETLKQAEVSAEQLSAAKNIQKHVFTTFDKVDEMSQRYSEDTEAGTQIAKQVFSMAWCFVNMGVTGILGFLILKGKLPFHKIAKTISDLSLQDTSPVKKFINKTYENLNKNKAFKENLFTSFTSEEKMKKLIDSEEFASLSKDFKSTFIELNKQEMKELFKLIRQKPKLILKIIKVIPELAKKNPVPVKELIKENPEIIQRVIDKNFKQDSVSKWCRNLFMDISKLIGRSKFKKQKTELSKIIPKGMPQEITQGITEEIAEKTKLNYENYKTLWNTLAIATAPLLTIFYSVPFAINAIFTNIQKKAGKIGIMKAMEDLDYPQLYVNQENSQSA